MSRLDKINQLAKLYEELSGSSQYLYILFVDLCGSTEYKQNLIDQGISDSVWLNRQLIFLSWCATTVRENKGTVVKTLGDGLMATFDFSHPPEEIVHLCVELHNFLDKQKSFTGKDRTRAKLSLDFGAVINGSIVENSYDPVGVCVDRCARLNSIANERETVFSDEFNKKLNTRDKSLIHSSIKTVKEENESLKGLGATKFFLIEII